MLYYILILSLIRSQPLVFQVPSGDVYLISNYGVQCAGGRWFMSGSDDVLTLVDTDVGSEMGMDMGSSIPNGYNDDASNLRVLLTSSPGPEPRRVVRRWLKQSVMDNEAGYVMRPWESGELIAMMFVHSELA
jgi:hypothetical protein